MDCTYFWPKLRNSLQSRPKPQVSPQSIQFWVQPTGLYLNETTTRNLGPTHWTVPKLDQNLKFPPHYLTKFESISMDCTYFWPKLRNSLQSRPKPQVSPQSNQFYPGFNLGPTHWTVPKLDQNLKFPPHYLTKFESISMDCTYFWPKPHNSLQFD